MRLDLGEYIVTDSNICRGRLTFRDTRIPVATVLRMLGDGDTVEQVLESWPRLTREAVGEALRYAAGLVHDNFGED